MDCNEVGFTPDNVRAICSIGASTKTGLTQSTRYIGEKGIGFKSVFKVADVVHVSSGHFQFKLDKSKTVGHIAPIWADFPEPTLQGHTSFYLKFSENCDEDNIVKQIRDLEPTLLMFLRQLKEISLAITEPTGRVWSQKLRKSNMTVGKNPTISLHQGDTVSEYIVVKHRAVDLPFEEKRSGCSESEVTIAFPIPNSKDPPTEGTEAVYAFLPIRHYGFKVSSGELNS